MYSHYRTANRLIAAMRDADFEPFSRHVEVVTLVQGVDLAFAHEPIRSCWFPLSGFVSIIAPGAAGIEVEVGMVGCEGMIDVGVVYGDTLSVARSHVRVRGHAVRVEAPALLSMMSGSEHLTRLMLAYARSSCVQAASSTNALAHYTIAQRLARWLLMAFDRTEAESIEITHDALSTILGVRRAGVTVALHSVAAEGLIAVRRGRISILDPIPLNALAGGSYGHAEKEYQRLIG